MFYDEEGMATDADGEFTSMEDWWNGALGVVNRDGIAIKPELAEKAWGGVKSLKVEVLFASNKIALVPRKRTGKAYRITQLDYRKVRGKKGRAAEKAGLANTVRVAKIDRNTAIFRYIRDAQERAGLGGRRLEPHVEINGAAVHLLFPREMGVSIESYRQWSQANKEVAR